MRELKIKGLKKDSHIITGRWQEVLSEKIKDHKHVIIVTDKKVFSIYKEQFPPFPVILLEQGEQNKTLESVTHLYSEFLRYSADRETFILCIGGGIVTDTAAFAASTFMRGLNFAFISTTLLSMVDAGIGGKNGVNFNSYKNIAGTFSQPDFVICDPVFLNTLDKHEIMSGYGEIIKHSLINRELFSLLEKNIIPLPEKDPDVISEIIHRSHKIKADIVIKDEEEAGLRKILNLGHTFAHSIERLSGISHGFAVAQGLFIATDISRHLDCISGTEAEQIRTLLKGYGFREFTGIYSDLKENIKKDKKMSSDCINLILLKGIGKPFIRNTPLLHLTEIMNDLYKS